MNRKLFVVGINVMEFGVWSVFFWKEEGGGLPAIFSHQNCPLQVSETAQTKIDCPVVSLINCKLSLATHELS
jgi:hypothetical protein